MTHNIDAADRAARLAHTEAQRRVADEGIRLTDHPDNDKVGRLTPKGYTLPRSPLDPAAFAKALTTGGYKLPTRRASRDGRATGGAVDDALWPLVAGTDGDMMVPLAGVTLIGGGDPSRGKRALDQLTWMMRDGRGAGPKVQKRRGVDGAGREAVKTTPGMAASGGFR